jgi:peroxiredoxin
MQKPNPFTDTPFKKRFMSSKATLMLATSLALFFILINALNQGTSKAPDVAFSTITGHKIALNALQGKPVIVTFWATDCAECLREIPDLIELYKQYHQQGLEIIAVAMDYDPPNHVIDLSKDLQLPYHVALDITGEQARAFGHVQLTPTTFLITPSGLIDLQKTGAFDLSELKSHIEKLLKG